MRTLQITTLLFLNWTFCFGQEYSKCKIIQFAEEDSLNQTLVSEAIFNTIGQTTTKYYSGFKTGKNKSYQNGIYFYSYKDDLLEKETYVDNLGDSTRMVYYHDTLGQILEVKFWEFKKRMKDGWVWFSKGQINYKYDENRNKIYRDASKFNPPYKPNKDSWTYDEKNRIIEHYSYDDTIIIWKEEYEYYQWGYQVSKYAQDFETKGYYQVPILKSNYKLNDNNQIEEESFMSLDGNFVIREKTFYNSKGKISKKHYYDSHGYKEITHIYQYE